MKDFTKYLNSLSFIKNASKTADELSVEVYIVGGFIRDFVLDCDHKDIDFLIVGNGIEFAERYAKSLGIDDVIIFKTYGTAHFKHEGFEFEFVGARKESYDAASRNPAVETGTFEDDINRRDLTINSIAASINSETFGEVIDLFGGLKDIEDRIIKTPLEPFVTFNDDPLRILRAIRFAARLDFKIEEKTFEALGKVAERLKIITQERITDEFLKIMSVKKPSVGLKYLYDSGVMQVIFPEIANLAGVDQRKDFHHKDVFLHTCEVVDNIAQASGDVWLRFAALLHDVAKPKTKRFVENVGWTFHGHEELGARMVKQIFKRMRLPMHKAEYVEKLVRLHLRPIALNKDEVTDSAIRRFIVAAGEDLDDLIILCRADITSKNIKKVQQYLKHYDIVMEKVRDVRERDKLREFQSPVRGEEIMRVCNIPPSKKVGEIKTAIEEAILDGEIDNNYEAAYEYLLKIKQNFISENS
ncbi:MAG: HD domain-containing protein [Chlorobi bacterium]|nr:HD domain-containing protein [Chlorobiota bacterium]